VAALLDKIKVKCFDSRDAEVMDLITNSWQDIPITENHIKQLHLILQ